MKRILNVCVSAALLSGFALINEAAAASKFPAKPVSLYVGFAAGGSTDTIARGLVDAAGEALGGKVLVVNKPGAGGAVAAALVAKAKGDGYTLQISPDTPLTRAPHLRKLAFDPMKDFTFISRVAVWKNGYVVLQDSKFKTWKDVVQWSKDHPGQLKVGVPGPGTTPDILMAVVAKREGITYRSTPFKGDSPNMAALLGGHIDVAGSGLGAWSKYVKAKKMRLLMVEDGVTGFPDAPDYKALGYDISSPTAAIIFGPKGMPDEIVNKLGEAFAAAAKSATFKTVAEAMELSEVSNPLYGKDLDKYVRENFDLYKKYVDEGGLAKKKKK